MEGSRSTRRGDATRVGLGKGAATSRKGRERVKGILKAARSVLVEDGHAQFSLRHVASRAGIHLRNLQYYFSTRDRLIHALCESIAQDYQQRLDAHLAGSGDGPLEQMEAMIDFYLIELQDPVARRRTMNEWALLSAMDEHVGHKLNEYYVERFSNRFVPLVRRLNPSFSKEEVISRSRIIAAIIDGMMIMVDRDVSSRGVADRLLSESRTQLMRIATGV